MEIRKHFGISERLDELAQNLIELNEATSEDRHLADLRRVEFATPLAILPLAVFISSHKIKFTCSERDTDVLDYLRTIGFPKGFEKLPGEGKKYLPITVLPPVEESGVLGKYEDMILKLASSSEYESSFRLSLKYLTSELANNVNEHAKVDQYWLLAQYWEKPRKTCEIVIADCGIGYKQSYEGTEYEVETDKEAIVNALEGKSSKNEYLRGQGIPSIAKLFTRGYGGKLIIMSGKAIIYDKEERRKAWDLKSSWQGALVGIIFDLKDVEFYRYLEQTR